MAVSFVLETAAFTVLVGMFLTACFARLSGRWLRWAGPTVFGWLPMLLGAVIFAAVLNVWSPAEWDDVKNYYIRAPMLVTMMVVVVIGLPVIVALLPFVGFRRKLGQSSPRAANWQLWPLLAGIAALIVAFFATVHVADRRVQQRVRAAQEDLDAAVRRNMPTVADVENAAPMLIEAGRVAGPKDELPEWFKDQDRSDYSGLPTGIFQLDFDAGAPVVQEFLQDKAKVIELALNASKRPRCWFNDPPVFDSISLPDEASEQLWRIHSVAKILALSARERAIAGDSKGCSRQLFAMRQIGRLLAEDPAVIRRLVGRSFECRRAQILEAILANRPELASQFPLPILTDDYSYRVGELRMLDTYRAHVFRAYSSLYSGAVYQNQNSRLNDETRIQFNRVRWLSEEWLRLLRVFLWDQESHAFLSLTGQLRNSLNEPAPWDRVEFFLAGRHGLSCLDLRMTLTAMALSSSTARTSRLADVGLAAAAFHARHGRYPVKLEALVPEFIDRLPIAPEDGNPMRMQSPSGGGIAIFFSGNDSTYKLDEFADMFCLGAAYKLWRTSEGATQRAKPPKL